MLNCIIKKKYGLVAIPYEQKKSATNVALHSLDPRISWYIVLNQRVEYKILNTNFV